MEYASAEEFTTFVREIAPPISALIDPHPQERQDETWAAITAAAARQASDDGSITQENLVLMAVGTA
jgi:hypothetical protein